MAILRKKGTLGNQWQSLINSPALDKRWKDLKMIRRHERGLVFTRLQTEMSILTKPNLAAEEVSSKPKKRRLLDFDESDDEESNKEDSMEAELKRFKTNL